MKTIIKILLAMATIMTASCGNAESPTESGNSKTLIVFYSFTGNCEAIVNTLRSQINADAVEIRAAEEGLDYAADNYAIGSALIAAIRENPDKAESYPTIKPVDVNLEEYSSIIVVAPLWWDNMAAPLQAYLFHNGEKMSGKHIGLIVSSWSSGIDDVVADAHRLIPGGRFFIKPLWINHTGQSNRDNLISAWLNEIDYSAIASYDINFLR